MAQSLEYQRIVNALAEAYRFTRATLCATGYVMSRR